MKIDLLEIGAKMTKARAEKVRAAFAALKDILDEIANDDSKAEEKAVIEQLVSEFDSELEEAVSFRQIERDLAVKLREKFPLTRIWVRDTFDDGTVIFEQSPLKMGPDGHMMSDYENAKLYQADWDADSNGNVTITGDPIAVRPVTVYEPADGSHANDADLASAVESYEPTEAELTALCKVYESDDDSDIAEAAKTGSVQTLLKTFNSKWAKGPHPHAACVAALKGKPDIKDPERLCAWFKDQKTGSTKWRGKSKKESASDSDVSDDPDGAEVQENEIDITGDLIDLSERAVRKDGTVMLKIIKPGWGSSGFYSAEMLRRDGPKVFTKDLHMYANHPTAQEDRERPERSITDLAGVLQEDARFMDQGPDGPGLYAPAKPLGVVKEMLEELAPHIGVSIRAMGKAKTGEAEGRKGPIIEGFTSAKSVDFVTQAGAGGKVLDLAESIRAQRKQKSKSASDAPVENGETTMSEQALKEATDRLTQAMGLIDNMKTQLEESDKKNDKLRRDLAIRDGTAMIERRLSTIVLPAEAKQKVLNKVSLSIPFTEAGEIDIEKLNEAVDFEAKAEGLYVARLGYGAGRITGLGETRADVQETEHASLLERASKAGERLGIKKENAVYGL